MKLFTVGPGEIYPETLRISGTQLPYFRNDEFSALMKENERYLLQLCGCSAGRALFLTGSGTGLSRRQIWAEMKRLCKHAGVEARKVFPHNLRHLFATTYYRVYKDIARLADILGHSSIETTRIYLLSTGVEHARQLEQLRLVS